MLILCISGTIYEFSDRLSMVAVLSGDRAIDGIFVAWHRLAIGVVGMRLPWLTIDTRSALIICWMESESCR